MNMIGFIFGVAIGYICKDYIKKGIDLIKDWWQNRDNDYIQGAGC